MITNNFDRRLNRIQWQPSAVPTPEIVDGILNVRPMPDLRGAALTLFGAILGILIGVGLKGMVIPDTTWGPNSGLIGAIVGTLSLAGLGLSVPLAALGAYWHKRRPRLLQFSSMNLLMIVVILLS
ncbi:hypothetical protein [Parasedimentitalea huanghaiensis]|uniref:Uncharacterized protein n=1 Tax=Parasedimentitalea huanghaiensis TaxID=2682100 RepID=A0A6L6WCU2_9RHOB|nr:hypothetical protein [Zongyanglinia huanghaiensis]MVO14375.1 hypothetical protein [Zongyanglinia huanghaiensis]